MSDEKSSWDNIKHSGLNPSDTLIKLVRSGTEPAVANNISKKVSKTINLAKYELYRDFQMIKYGADSNYLSFDDFMDTMNLDGSSLVGLFD